VINCTFPVKNYDTKKLLWRSSCRLIMKGSRGAAGVPKKCLTNLNVKRACESVSSNAFAQEECCQRTKHQMHCAKFPFEPIRTYQPISCDHFRPYACTAWSRGFARAGARRLFIEILEKRRAVPVSSSRQTFYADQVSCIFWRSATPSQFYRVISLEFATSRIAAEATNSVCFLQAVQQSLILLREILVVWGFEC